MILGDSITEVPAWYPRYVEGYLLMCTGRSDIKVCTAGHSGETLAGLLARQSDLQAFNPTVVMFNEGMNDSQYSAYTDAKGAAFDSTMQQVLAGLASKGILQRIVAGPGNVADPDPNSALDGCLGKFSAIGHADAAESGSYDADVYGRMQKSYLAAKAVYGPTWGYGAHQGPNGAILMAYEMLRTLACRGTIGNINVDMNGGATASAGHTVVSASNGVVVLDSTTYPFCYNYDPANETGFDSLDSVLPCVPFSQDLNRFMLTVTNLSGTSADVTWGGRTMTFTSGQLAAGVNLAEQFTTTPFDATFARVVTAIVNKQYFENYMIKFTGNYYGNDNGGNVDQNMIDVQAQLDAGVKALIVPVRHTIVIVPNGSSGPALPVITGTMMAYTTAGNPFSYQISTFKPASSFSASGLPDGLSLNTGTGLINGTPTASGASAVTVSAVNASGTGSTTLTVTVEAQVPMMPAITSPGKASGTVGVPFTYQIAATNNPSNYFVTVPSSQGTEPPASSLPPGLAYNTHTGLISGAPTATGTFPLQVTAMNANLDGIIPYKTVTLTVAPSGGAPSAPAGSAPPTGNTQVSPASGGGVPPAPAGLTATAGNTQVSLSWTASAGATSYKIYRGTLPGAEYDTPIVTGIAATSYTDTNLPNGPTQYYKVVAVNASGASGYSHEASASPASGSGGQ